MLLENYDNRKDGKRVRLTEKERDRLLKLYKDNHDTRRYIGLGLMAYCGCRSQEAVDVRPTDIIDSDEAARTFLRIYDGKHGSERLTPMSDEFAEEIRHYTETWRIDYRDSILDVTTRTLRRWVKRAARMRAATELYQLRGLSMVLIANDDKEFFAELSNRVTSRFQTSARIRFSPYTQDELISILNDRVRWGLRHDTITDEQVEQIAGAAGGDASNGIHHVAARRTTRAGQNAITDAVIKQAVSEAKTEIRQKTLEKLTTHQTILYDIITDYGEITPHELYTRYHERASNPRSNRMVRNYLSKLCHYNLIAADGENRGWTYRPLSSSPS